MCLSGVYGVIQSARPKHWTVRVTGRLLRPTGMPAAQGPAFRSGVQLSAWFPECKRRVPATELSDEKYHLDEKGNFQLDLTLDCAFRPTVGYLSFERTGYQKKSDLKFSLRQAENSRQRLLGQTRPVRLRLDR